MGLVPSSVKVLGKQMRISTKFDSGGLGPYFSKVLKSHLPGARVLAPGLVTGKRKTNTSK